MGACIGSVADDGFTLVGFYLPANVRNVPQVTPDSLIKIVPLHSTSDSQQACEICEPIITTVANYSVDTVGFKAREVAGIWIK